MHMRDGGIPLRTGTRVSQVKAGSVFRVVGPRTVQLMLAILSWTMFVHVGPTVQMFQSLHVRLSRNIRRNFRRCPHTSPPSAARSVERIGIGLLNTVALISSVGNRC